MDSCAAHIPAPGPCGASFVPQLPQCPRVARPVALDLDPDAEHDFAAEARLHLAPRIARDLLEGGARRTDHDRLVAVTLDPDGRLDASQLSFLFEALERHVASVRQLFAEPAEKLLAQNLRRQESLVAIVTWSPDTRPALRSPSRACAAAREFSPEAGKTGTSAANSRSATAVQNAAARHDLDQSICSGPRHPRLARDSCQHPASSLHTKRFDTKSQIAVARALDGRRLSGVEQARMAAIPEYPRADMTSSVLDPGQHVSGRLRLRRDDRQLLADARSEARLAVVGTPAQQRCAAKVTHALELEQVSPLVPAARRELPRTGSQPARALPHAPPRIPLVRAPTVARRDRPAACDGFPAGILQTRLPSWRRSASTLCRPA